MIDKLASYSQLIIIVGGLLTLFGSYRSYRQSNIDSEAAKKALDEVLARTTGGDSFCIVDMYISASDIDKKPKFTVFLKGTIPLKNVVIKIEDYAKRTLQIEREGITDPTSIRIQEILKENEYTFNYSAVYPDSKFTNIELPIDPEQDDLIYFVTIDSDSGRTTQIITFKNYKTNNSTYNVKVSKNDSLIIDSPVPIQLMAVLSE